ncbi:uncharacterized protein LOC117107542 [Anneissia japonica]|uniref:uncharacterized protein LOC117107542 n=1 Tax=Anneissia japonica TaxID=1529436 RepID=UPI00142559CD|nr:uncharacterized protein LOC117107542 [Anneissia japonica]
MVFSENGMTLDPNKVDVIQCAKSPESASECRSLLGIRNFVSGFFSAYAELVAPVLKPIKKKCCVVLTQEGHVVAYGSKTMSEVETRYSQIECETLVIAWACGHFCMFDVLVSKATVSGKTNDKVPDITAFSSSFIVDGNTATNLFAFTGYNDNNDNVNFGVGLWVDDNGTHYDEKELKFPGPLANSIFTSGFAHSSEFCKNSNMEPTALKCELRFDVDVGVRRVGVKYMWTELNGIKASASVVFLANEATVVAEHRTITTSIGETVHLVMSLNDIDEGSLRWKKDGGSDIMEWDGLSNVSLKNLRIKDTGIYECYPKGQRHLGQHAILRLLVRECPRGKWLPPDCENNCPLCYNGGVCSVSYGLCICPPGFKGDNCEIACGYNNWGRDCSIPCSSLNPGCPGFLFCPPDPFGCSCMSGYGDLDCKRVCDTGTTGKYGPGCLLDCHCNATECQPSEGCNENATCHTGYTGTRCLERDPNVECPAGYYGPQCTKICHCQISSKCDRNNGSCPNGDVCEGGWAGAGCQQLLLALSDAPLVVAFANNVNIRWSTWSLDNDYGRGTVDSYQLEYWPTNDVSDLVVLNITIGTEMNISWSQMNYNTEYSFTVKVITEVEGVLVSGKASPLAEILSRPTTKSSYEERQTTESTTVKGTTVPLTSGAKGQTTGESTTAKVTTIPLTSGAKGQTTESTTAKVTTVPLTSGTKGQTTGKRFKNDVPVIRVCRNGRRFSCSSNSTSVSSKVSSNVCKVCGKP